MSIKTLEEAKDWLRTRLKNGTRCPCCTLHVKIYERPIYSSMAAALIYFYRNYNCTEFIHKSELVKANGLATTFGGGDFAKLAYWGLIEEKKKEGEKENKRTSGYWRITERGMGFAEGKLRIKSHARIYGGKLLCLFGKEVTITDCLGKKFSYAELMNLNYWGEH